MASTLMPEFYEERSSLIPRQIKELGEAILHLAKTVPDGLVVFFPSYAYLDTVTSAWQKPASQNPSSPPLWTFLSQQKRIFLEPRSATKPSHDSSLATSSKSESSSTPADKVDKVLAAYTAHIRSGTGNGALLLAVIGGSLSEGINFSDALGRCVAVVGLPFPNAQSAEWKAKLEFVAQRQHQLQPQHNKTSNTSTSATKPNISNIPPPDPARDFYENACMRAVNQSVGRAIRHKDDYAAIVLFDKRYEREGIKAKLPGWIREGFRTRMQFREVVRGLETFFQEKK